MNGTNDKARLWLTGNNGNSSWIQSEHVGSGSMQLGFPTSQGNTLPTRRLVIDQLGTVIINDGDIDNGQGKLVVSGSDVNGVSVFFYHSNRTQGIGISYDGLT